MKATSRFLSIFLVVVMLFSVVSFADDTGITGEENLLRDPNNYQDQEKKYIQDLNQLVMFIQQNHVRVKESGYSQEERTVINEAYNKITYMTTQDEFYLIANSIVCSLRDSNSFISLYFTDTSQINLPFQWFDDGLIVLEDTDQFRKNDKIVSIGNKTVEELEELLYTIIPADNKYRVRAKAPEMLIKYPVLSYLGLTNDNSSVTVRFIRDGKEDRINLTRAYKVDVPELDKVDNGSWYVDEVKDIAYINVSDSKYGYNSDGLIMNFEDMFEMAHDKKVMNVVIDLRELKLGSSNTLVEAMKLFLPDGQEYYTNGGNKVRIDKTEDDFTYNGDVFLLIGGNTYENGIKFADILQANNLATIVGEPSGVKTNFAVNTSGLNVRLFHSWVRCYLANGEVTRPLPNLAKEIALVPDKYFPKMVEDFLGGKDLIVDRIADEIKASYDYLPGQKTIDAMKTRVFISDLVDGDTFDDSYRVWFEDFVTRERIPVKLIVDDGRRAFDIPNEIDFTREYYLITSKSYETRKATLTQFEVVRPETTGVFEVTYASKFNYAILYHNYYIVKQLNNDAIQFLDSNNNEVLDFGFDTLDHYSRPYVSTFTDQLAKGEYRVIFKAGAVEYYNGLINEEFELTFTID